MQKAIPLEYVNTRIAGIDDDLISLDKDIARLKVEREMLCGIKKAAVDMIPPPRMTIGFRGDAESLTTTDIILSTVASAPGIHVGELTSKLENKIQSESGDKRRVISASITNLMRKGRLGRDQEGRLWPNNGHR